MTDHVQQAGETNRLLPGLIYELTSTRIWPQGPSLVGSTAAKVTPDGERDRDDFAGFNFGPGAEPVPGYHLVSRIGRGSTGEVWKAIGPGGFPLAMKFVGMGERDAADEWHSLSLMKDVHHPNLITLFGTWELDGLLIVGMELAEGTLHDLCEETIGRGGAGLPFGDLVAYLEQAARGLDFLNGSNRRLLDREEIGLLHRDIKPQNLLLVGGGVKVGDFGLVTRLDGSARLYEAESLAPAYIPPEWAEGRFSRQSDQYSLAMTYHGLSTGSPPRPLDAFDGQTDATGELDLSALPEGQRAVIARALSRDPERRWPDCLTFVRELTRAGEHERARCDIPAEVAIDRSARSPARSKMQEGTSRGRRIVAATGLLMLMLIALAWRSHRVGDDRGPRHPALAPEAPRAGTEPRQAGLVAETVPVDEASHDTVARRADPLVTLAKLAGAIAAQERGKLRRVLSPLGRGLASVDWKRVAEWPKLEPSRPTIQPADPVEIPAASPPPAEVVEAPKPGPPTGVSPSEIPRPDDPQPPPARSGEGHQSSLFPDGGRGKAKAIEALYTVIKRDLSEALNAARPRPVTINVLLPNAKGELIVRGDVGRGNPDEWYGPKRVIHSPPLGESKDYLVGCFWTDSSGRPQTRSKELKVKPGGVYEVDLRIAEPTVKELDR